MKIPKTANRNIQIGVIGDSESSPDEDIVANQLGYHLAKLGVTVISGGRNNGIMSAVSQGACDAGGLTIGILPSNDGADANSYLKVVIPTGMGWTRNSFVVLSSDVIIIIGGKSGTLNEMTFAWIYDKPIIALVTSDIPSDSWGARMAGEKFDNRRNDKIYYTTDPLEAAKLAITLALDNKSSSDIQ